MEMGGGEEKPLTEAQESRCNTNTFMRKVQWITVSRLSAAYML